MDKANVDWDATGYFEGIITSNRLAKGKKYVFCKVSSDNALEEVMQNMRKYDRFFAVNETTDGKIYNTGSGYMNLKICTCFIFARYKRGNETSRLDALIECRALFAQIHARMIIDSDKLYSQLIYLNANNILLKEMPEMQLNGCVGMYFTFNMDIPVDRVVNDEDWL